MADFVFNIAKGRVAEYAQRVISNDPTNSALIVVLLTTVGIEADDTLNNYDDLSTLLAAANTEATFTNYARKEVTAPTRTPNDTTNLQDVDMPDQTWTAAGNGVNNNLSDLLVCYDNDTTGTGDSNLVPLTCHDFVVTTDGSDLTAKFNAAGFFEATA